jgi:hypothetical protein
MQVSASKTKHGNDDRQPRSKAVEQSFVIETQKGKVEDDRKKNRRKEIQIEAIDTSTVPLLPSTSPARRVKRYPKTLS